MAYKQMCVLGFSKAFDKVGHQRLVEKLKWYGIQGNVNHWIADFLKNRTQSVVIEGVSSSKVPVISCVPQGSVLGPCLFLYYINDIAEQLTSTTRLFADDTMIYMAVKGENDAKLLQADLNKLTDWEDKWIMQFHPDKCEVISITRKKNPIITNYTLHGHQLQHVNSVKYLGLTVSNDLRWDKHVDRAVAKANNTLGFLRRNLNIHNPKVKAHAYKSLVRPPLEYSCSYGTLTLIISQKNLRRSNVVQQGLLSTNPAAPTVSLLCSRLSPGQGFLKEDFMLDYQCYSRFITT